MQRVIRILGLRRTDRAESECNSNAVQKIGSHRITPFKCLIDSIDGKSGKGARASVVQKAFTCPALFSGERGARDGVVGQLISCSN